MIMHPALGNRAAVLHRSARSGSLRSLTCSGASSYLAALTRFGCVRGHAPKMFVSIRAPWRLARGATLARMRVSAGRVRGKGIAEMLGLVAPPPVVSPALAPSALIEFVVWE
jgi:hypothetical protein